MYWRHTDLQPGEQSVEKRNSLCVRVLFGRERQPRKRWRVLMLVGAAEVDVGRLRRNRKPARGP